MDLKFMVLNKRIRSITSQQVVIPAQVGIHSNGNYCGFRIILRLRSASVRN